MSAAEQTDSLSTVGWRWAKLRFLSACMVPIILILAGTPTEATWRGTDWGMSPEAVARAVNGAMIAEARGEPVTFGHSTYWQTVSAELEWGGIAGKTVFLFDDGGSLQRISIQLGSPEACEALLDYLYSEFQAPSQVVPVVSSGKKILDLMIWRSTSAGLIQYTRADSCTALISNPATT